jgi:beta-galactosidase/beta-glucuronidase
MSWQPAPAPLLTRWAQTVSPQNAWREYPRPHMRRPEWLNLNGLWEYFITGANQATPRNLASADPAGEILVPFPIESALSGVGRPLGPGERLWYRKSFSVPAAWAGKRLLLHFGAVDWEATVWVNGSRVGSHRGGYLPFWFDISDSLAAGKNSLQVSVWDPTDSGWQARGKQVRRPRGIWYSAVSGIWQTVWLEPVPQVYIAGLKITPDLEAGAVRVRVDLGGTLPASGGVRVAASDQGVPIVERSAGSPGQELVLPIPNPKLWSPDQPHLYDLSVTAGDDRVESYFGLRKFSLGPDKQGRRRLCLNDRPLFQLGPLDQGYWPDGLYTPPSEQAMRWDLGLIKRLGFNMLRKHVKVEPARYYYECDRLGLIVWQDMPNGGAIVGDLPTFLALAFGARRKDGNYRLAGRADPASREDFQRELQELVEHLYNFPCIGMWVPFNEGWGQFDAARIAGWLTELDPTRPVDHASGFYDQQAGDCRSWHVYFKDLPASLPVAGRAEVLSEFGGYSLKLAGHLWNPKAEFGYRKFTRPATLTAAYLDLLDRQLKPWAAAGLSAAIYTQTTDVEIEVNGYVTYDREVEKMDFERIGRVHREIITAQENL